MKNIKIAKITTPPQKVVITASEYATLKAKAEAFDAYKQAQRNRAKRISDILTPEQRSERARAAALARWNKQQKEED